MVDWVLFVVYWGDHCLGVRWVCFDLDVVCAVALGDIGDQKTRFDCVSNDSFVPHSNCGNAHWDGTSKGG